MSDSPQGAGWWQASDGKYYPPELHPDAAATPDDSGQGAATGDGAANGADGPPGEGYWQASDGNWYAPELHPDAQPAVTEAPSPTFTTSMSDSSVPGSDDTATAGDSEPGGSDAAGEDGGTTAGGQAPGDAADDAAPQTSGRETVFMPGVPAEADGPAATDEPPPASPPPGSPPPGSPPPGSPPPASPPPGSPPPGSPPPGSPPPASPPPASPPPASPPPGVAPPTAGPGPGGPPPVGGPPPAAAGGGGQKKKGKAGKIILIILLVLALVIAAFAVNAIFFSDEAAADVVLEPIGADREAPFTQSVAPEPAGSLLDYASREGEEMAGATTQTAGYQTADGSVPGIYGGTLNESSCDPDLLEGFLVAEDERATAWAEVLEISADDIPPYLDGLTPVNLAADTRVRNHGFQDGEAVPRQAILQRGSAVLIDTRGVPRVDCYSGSPLREPEALDDEAFTGEQWENFQRERVIVIDRSSTDLDMFELEDVDTGDIFARPAGSRGGSDRPGTIDLVNDGPVDFDVLYEDSLIEGRSEARYFVDAPDGAIMTIRVDNRRDSQSTVDVEVVSRGTTFARETFISPGASYEQTIILDHEGGGEFEILFSRGPAAYDFEIELDVQRDAGQEGDAGDSFDTGRQIRAGERIEGLLGGQDAVDVFLIDVVPGAEVQFLAENLRGSSGSLDVEVRLADSVLLRETFLGAAGTYAVSTLLSGDDAGVLEVIVSRGPSNYAFMLDLVEQNDAGQNGDAGDSRSDPRAIGTDGPLSGQVGHRDPADWYVFQAPGPGVEIVVTNQSSSSGDLNATVEDASASGQARQTFISSGTQTTLTFEAEPGEDYWLYFEGGRSDYTFEIREVSLDDG